MTGRRLPRVLGFFLLAAWLLTGCTGREPIEAEDLPAFDSIEQAYEAVDQSVGCVENPEGEPTPAVDGADELPSGLRLCAEYFQVDFYPDEESLQQSFEIWSGTTQGEIHLIRGRNWLVLEYTDVVTGEPTTRNMEALAEDLGGEYTVAG